MFRTVGRFLYNVVAATVAHLALMLAGLIVSLILLGKHDEGLLDLVLCCCVPFFLAGIFISDRHLNPAYVVAVVAGFLALLMPRLLMIWYQEISLAAWYQQADLSAEVRNWLPTTAALPFSVLGVMWGRWRNRRRSEVAGHQDNSPPSSPTSSGSN